VEKQNMMTIFKRLTLHQSVVDLALNQTLKLKPLETMISIRSSTICKPFEVAKNCTTKGWIAPATET